MNPPIAPVMKLVNAVVVLLGIALVIGVFWSLLRLDDDSRPRGSEKLIGMPLPEFALPLAGSGIDRDANIVDRVAARGSGQTAACDVRVEGAFVSCRDLPGTAVIAFFRREDENCLRQVDELEKAFAGRNDVSTVAIAIKEPVAPVAGLVSRRGWRLPVAVDRDAAASELFLVSGCPSTYFAKDGEITGVRLGLQDAAALRGVADSGEPDPGGADAGTREEDDG